MGFPTSKITQFWGILTQLSFGDKRQKPSIYKAFRAFFVFLKRLAR
jgi:hypothetical protein